ncbi:flagellar basal-body rod protein FlgF [Litorivivens sp.]|uniref:flagellar basal-body rod protein FlgF n=1 Tax=Litorivivens sp. TaxID=2020868 RepID=UPI0035672FBD
MDKLLYLGMTGAKQTSLAQATNANNLANVSTTGFRADFNSLFAEQIAGAGLPSRSNSVAYEKGIDTNPGSLQHTGRTLDVAVSGDGWFAVQTPDGREAYTRRGDLQLTSDGQLLTGQGHNLLGDGGPIAIPEHSSISIGGDGSISIVPLGQGPDTQIVIDRIRLVSLDASQLEKGEDGLIRQRDGAEGVNDAGLKLVSGALESSNVNAVDSMVRMIQLARRYEMDVKMMSTAGEIADAGASLMRLS